MDSSENEHVKKVVSGDVFILKVSDEEDKNGRGFYADLEPAITAADLRHVKRSLSEYCWFIRRRWH